MPRRQEQDRFSTSLISETHRGFWLQWPLMSLQRHGELLPLRRECRLLWRRSAEYWMRFSVPNALNKYRVDPFSSKEPETLQWIDRIPRASVMWDVGANIGLYSCYAAKARGCRVFAFEPSVFNLEALARNIFLNRLTELITIVPLPLSDELAVSKFRMTSTD